MRKVFRILLASMLALALFMQLMPAFTAFAEDVIGAVRINAGSNAKVRDSASFDGKNVGEAKAGKEYDLLEDAGQWFKIRLVANTVGWIYNSTAQIVQKLEQSAAIEVTATSEPAKQDEGTSSQENKQETSSKNVQSVIEGHFVLNRLYDGDDRLLIADQNGLKVWIIGAYLTNTMVGYNDENGQTVVRDNTVPYVYLMLENNTDSNWSLSVPFDQAPDGSVIDGSTTVIVNGEDYNFGYYSGLTSILTGSGRANENRTAIGCLILDGMKANAFLPEKITSLCFNLKLHNQKDLLHGSFVTGQIELFIDGVDEEGKLAEEIKKIDQEINIYYESDERPVLADLDTIKINGISFEYFPRPTSQINVSFEIKGDIPKDAKLITSNYLVNGEDCRIFNQRFDVSNDNTGAYAFVNIISANFFVGKYLPLSSEIETFSFDLVLQDGNGIELVNTKIDFPLK